MSGKQGVGRSGAVCWTARLRLITEVQGIRIGLSIFFVLRGWRLSPVRLESATSTGCWDWLCNSSVRDLSKSGVGSANGTLVIMVMTLLFAKWWRGRVGLPRHQRRNNADRRRPQSSLSTLSRQQLTNEVGCVSAQNWTSLYPSYSLDGGGSVQECGQRQQNLPPQLRTVTFS
jgi:hypothetical protein